jgi:hypothetical protein
MLGPVEARGLAAHPISTVSLTTFIGIPYRRNCSCIPIAAFGFAVAIRIPIPHPRTALGFAVATRDLASTKAASSAPPHPHHRRWPPAPRPTHQRPPASSLSTLSRGRTVGAGLSAAASSSGSDLVLLAPTRRRRAPSLFFVTQRFRDTAVAFNGWTGATGRLAY